jgi:hypothetical protein
MKDIPTGYGKLIRKLLDIRGTMDLELFFGYS